MDIEVRGETSHTATDSLMSCQSQRKKGKVTNVFLTDLDEAKSIL